MVRVQAAEAGTIGQGRSFRFVHKDTIFDLPGGVTLPDWVAVVPDNTKLGEPLALVRDPKTKVWKVAGQRAAPDEGPRTFSELANADHKAAEKAFKAKTAINS